MNDPSVRVDGVQTNVVRHVASWNDKNTPHEYGKPSDQSATKYSPYPYAPQFFLPCFLRYSTRLRRLPITISITVGLSLSLWSQREYAVEAAAGRSQSARSRPGRHNNNSPATFAQLSVSVYIIQHMWDYRVDPISIFAC